MPHKKLIPPGFLAYCRRWSETMGKMKTDPERIRFIQEELPKMLLDPSAIGAVLENIAGGKSWPDIRQAAMFSNEVLFHLDERRLYSIRAYFFGPGEWTRVHDHTSWGVSGAPAGTLGVVKYRREEDEETEGDARLTETNRLALRPGQVDVTLPLGKGIHRTGNPDSDGAIVMVSVYGKPAARRLHINIFDPETDRMWQRFPPKMKMKRYAKQTLSQMG